MNEPHARFTAWLLGGADGEPARDLALHATLCPDCQRQIAAIDLLAAIDTGLAPAPPHLAGRRMPGALSIARVAGATAGVALLAAIGGLSAVQLLRPPASQVARESATPEDAVLGGAGSPSTTPSAPPTAMATAVATPPPNPAPTPSIPQVTPPPATPRPTLRPTAAPTAAPTIAPTAPPTASPTEVPTELPTASPTPEVSIAPSESPTPTPVPSASPTPGPSAAL